MTIVVAGYGPIGKAVVGRYVEAGVPVRVLTRSGSGPDDPLVERRKVDVTDAAALASAIEGATIIHYCIHASAYDAKVWAAELPAAEKTLLAAAERVGAAVVFPESLYSFDTSDVVTESTPHEARTGKPGVRAELLRARAASPVPTASVVASDYFGPGAGGNAHAGDRMLGPATSGGTVRPIGAVDVPHSWTYLPDLAAAMIRAGESALEDGYPGDRVWFAPTAPPMTQRVLANAYATAAGAPAPKIAPVPAWIVRGVGIVDRMMRGVAEMLFLFDRPLVMDSSASERELGLAPTPMPEAVRATVEAYLEAEEKAA